MNLKPIEEDIRDSFLGKYFGSHSVIVEGIVFNIMRQKTDEYMGGQWKFYEVEHAGKRAPLMVWGEDEEVTLNSAHEEFKTNGLTASIAVMIMALNHYSFSEDCEIQDKLLKYHDIMFDAVLENTDERIDGSVIYSVLD